MQAGHFERIPNLKILVDGRARGWLEMGDYEAWTEESEVSNWFWITLERDDGVWLEGSPTAELTAPDLTTLEARTKQVIELLTGAREGPIGFQPTKEQVADPDPEPIDPAGSILFEEVDALVSAAVQWVMAKV